MVGMKDGQPVGTRVGLVEGTWRQSKFVSHASRVRAQRGIEREGSPLGRCLCELMPTHRRRLHRGYSGGSVCRALAGHCGGCLAGPASWQAGGRGRGQGRGRGGGRGGRRLTDTRSTIIRAYACGHVHVAGVVVLEGNSPSRASSLAGRSGSGSVVLWAAWSCAHQPAPPVIPGRVGSRLRRYGRSDASGPLLRLYAVTARPGRHGLADCCLSLGRVGLRTGVGSRASSSSQ